MNDSEKQSLSLSIALLLVFVVGNIKLVTTVLFVSLVLSSKFSIFF